MIVVDSSGWVEFFTDGALADDYAKWLRNLSAVVTPVIVLYEVYKRLKRDLSEDDVVVAAVDDGAVVQPVEVDLDGVVVVERGAGRHLALVVGHLDGDVEKAAIPAQREQRRALILSVFHGRTAQEISHLEQIPLGTAKTRIRAGLQKVRALLDDEAGRSD